MIDPASVDFGADDGVITASLEGEIDLSNAATMFASIADGVPNEATALILDMSDVRYIDSSGLRMLLELSKRLGWRDQTIRIVVPADAGIRRILSLSGVEPVLPIDASLEIAREHLDDHTDPRSSI